MLCPKQYKIIVLRHDGWEMIFDSRLWSKFIGSRLDDGISCWLMSLKWFLRLKLRLKRCCISLIPLIAQGQGGDSTWVNHCKH